MIRTITLSVFALGLCCFAACAAPVETPAAETAGQPSPQNEESAGYSLLWIVSPRPGQDLSGAKEVRVAWESLLGEGVEYSVVFSWDGKTFDREIASKLIDYQCTLKPDDLPLAGWIKVKAFRDGYLLAESVVPVSFVPPTAVLICKANQRVIYLSGGELQDVFICSTALPGYDLKAGSYSVYLKQKRHWGKKWEVWMPHSVFFHEGYALHATTVIHRLGRPASHGCIRLHPRDARKLYGEVEVGTPVIVLPRTKSCTSLQSFLKPEEPPKTTMAAKRD